MTENDRSEEIGERTSTDIETDDAWFRSDQARALGVHIDQLNVLPRSEFLENDSEDNYMESDFVPESTNPLITDEELVEIQISQVGDQAPMESQNYQQQNFNSMQNASQNSSVRNTLSSDIQNNIRSEVEYYLDYSRDDSLIQNQTVSVNQSRGSTTSSSNQFRNRSDIDRSRVVNYRIKNTSQIINYNQSTTEQSRQLNSPSPSQTATTIINQNVDFTRR